MVEPAGEPMHRRVFFLLHLRSLRQCCSFSTVQLSDQILSIPIYDVVIWSKVGAMSRTKVEIDQQPRQHERKPNTTSNCFCKHFTQGGAGLTCATTSLQEEPLRLTRGRGERGSAQPSLLRAPRVVNCRCIRQFGTVILNAADLLDWCKI